MKKFYLSALTSIFLILVLSLNTQAQDEDEARFLIDSENVNISGFGGPYMNFSFVNDEFASYFGGGGAALINGSFFFGGYGESLTSMHQIERKPPCTDFAKNSLSLSNGGLWFGYILNPHKLLHLKFDTKIGWGGISLYDKDYDVANFEHCARDKVFTAVPSIALEINLLKWMKFNVSSGYRFVTGIDKSIYDENMFNQPTIQAELVFGNFQHD